MPQHNWGSALQTVLRVLNIVQLPMYDYFDVHYLICLIIMGIFTLIMIAQSVFFVYRSSHMEHMVMTSAAM